VTQAEQLLPCKREALISNPSTTKVKNENQIICSIPRFSNVVRYEKYALPANQWHLKIEIE
jgi:hypothetical protein